MIVPRTFAGQDVGVFGLARTGISAARALAAGGAHVFAWDDTERGRETTARGTAQIVPIESWPWDRLRTVVLSPGVPLTHPAPHDVVTFARKAGVEVVGDIELFARELRSESREANAAPIIAVTGTNGKSTTTALIGHILSSCGYDAQAGGNIGNPVLDLEPPLASRIYVLEVSSYQIELSPGLSPDVALLTNLTPDHLDRHGSMENYAAIKARLLEQAVPSGRVCVSVDDTYCAAIYSRLTASRGADAIPLSVGKVLGRGIFVLNGILYDALGSRAERVMELAGVAKLPGAHNWQNAAFAYAAVRPFVRDIRAIAEAMASFPGLLHRMEDVGSVGRVRFVNDSKATNADAAERALECFRDIFWIAGGRPKEGGIGSLTPHFERVCKAYLIGEAADEFARTLQSVRHEICGTLKNAVFAAWHDAQSSNCAAPVVLLAPACASFDQFENYEQRGDEFRTLVRNLAAEPVREAS